VATEFNEVFSDDKPLHNGLNFRHRWYRHRNSLHTGRADRL